MTDEEILALFDDLTMVVEEISNTVSSLSRAIRGQRIDSANQKLELVRRRLRSYRETREAQS